MATHNDSAAQVAGSRFSDGTTNTPQFRQILSLQVGLPLCHVEVCLCLPLSSLVSNVNICLVRQVWFQNRFSGCIVDHYIHTHFIYRRTKEKTRTCKSKSSLTKKTRTSKSSSSPLLSLPLTWDPTLTSYTPSSPDPLIIADSTISHWAENGLNPNNPSPDSRGLEDESSVCDGPLPVTNRNEHIYTPVTVIHQDSIVNGCQHALHTNHVDVNVEELNGSSHTHSMDNRHDDMSTTTQPTTAQNSASRWYSTFSLPGVYHSTYLPPFPYVSIPSSHISTTSSTSIPSFDHMRTSSDWISTSPLYQTCSSGFSSSINNTYYGTLAGNYGHVKPPVAAMMAGSFDSYTEAVRAEVGLVFPPSFKFSPKTRAPVEVEHEHAAVPQTPDWVLLSPYFDWDPELDNFLHENPQGQATNRCQSCSHILSTVLASHGP